MEVIYPLPLPFPTGAGGFHSNSFSSFVPNLPVPSQGWALAVVIKTAGISRVPTARQAASCVPWLHCHMSFPRQPYRGLSPPFYRQETEAQKAKMTCLRLPN